MKTTLDEIDNWLFESFGILPGCCSSTESLRYNTARMVAEVLWPKKGIPLVPPIKDDLLEKAGEIFPEGHDYEYYGG